MQRTITSFYEFCYLLSVNKYTHSSIPSALNIYILNYFRNYSKYDITILEKKQKYSKVDDYYLDSDMIFSIKTYLNHYIYIWELINKKNIKAVSCCYIKNNKCIFGLCYRYLKNIYNSEYQLNYEILKINSKSHNIANIVPINEETISNISDFRFIYNLRKNILFTL